MLAEEGNFARLARINQQLIGRVEAIDSPERVVLDQELLFPEIDRQQKHGKQVVFRAGPRGRPGVASAGGIAGAKAAATKAGRSRFELLECGRMGRCP